MARYILRETNRTYNIPSLIKIEYNSKMCTPKKLNFKANKKFIFKNFINIGKKHNLEKKREKKVEGKKVDRERKVCQRTKKPNYRICSMERHCTAFM